MLKILLILRNFVLNLWLYEKFFSPLIPRGNSGTRIFIKMLQINLHTPKILRTFAGENDFIMSDRIQKYSSEKMYIYRYYSSEKM